MALHNAISTLAQAYTDLTLKQRGSPHPEATKAVPSRDQYLKQLKQFVDEFAKQTK